MRKRVLLASALMMTALAAPAGAADMPVAIRGSLPAAPQITPSQPNWFVHVGPGGILLSEGAKMSVGGVALPGASIRVDSQMTAVIEAGYFLTPNWAVSFTGGVPPKIDIRGKGDAAPLGRLGSAVYGPATLTAHYHFRDFGAFQPYIGGGLAIMKVFTTSDGAMSNLKINDTVGFVGQIGANFMVNDQWGVFIDVKKAYLRTLATGTLGGAPARAKTTLDPLVVHTGVNYRF